MIIHKPVLLKESIELLKLKPGMTVVDATLGGGGHSLEILKEIGARGRLVAIDQDENAIENFKRYLKPEVGNIFLAKDNFSNLEKILGGQGIYPHTKGLWPAGGVDKNGAADFGVGVNRVDGILADLGYSSAQMEDESYGLSFLKEAELDMRLDKDRRLTAKEIVNSYAEKDLERILREYGEEKFAKNIARAIGKKRKIGEIRTTKELVQVIENAVPEKYKRAKIHPATRTFQALRIEVNQELENLEKFIPQAIKALSPGGRLAIISFHSLEDRIVKNIFRENARGCICPPDFPQCRCGNKPKVKIITKKPIAPDPEEIKENPRSRSAKLRICEKL